MSEICVASHHHSVAELLEDREFRTLAGRDGFLVELRLDHYKDLSEASLAQALAVFAPNTVATYRHPAEGGRRPGVEDAERLRFLQLAADHGVKYVDIEARTPRGGFDKKNAKLILSHHDFASVPAFDVLVRQCKTMSAEPGVDIVKIACFPEKILESVPILKLLQIMHTKPLVALGMGEAGFWTRVAGPLFGSPLTYARGESAPGTAPGQPTWRELDEIYRYREIRPGWPVYGVIGNPIAHSLSPLLHNTALKTLRLNGVYLPFKVDGDPTAFIKAFVPLGLKALSVTLPHKEAVRASCSEVHGLAESIGAVNTLLLREDGWWGTNTDAFAAADALEAVTGSVYDKKVLILGAGGAAKAVAFGLKTRGAEIHIANRTIEHAVTLSSTVGGKVLHYSEITRDHDFLAIINTTSIGMHPDAHNTPLQKDQISPRAIVFDTVYNPLRTKFLDMASELGCRTLEGVTMFIRQGAAQFELYTGQKPPQDVVEAVVLKELRKRQAAH
jgi:3-dehydroquinate dehydratase/shikimate dehydrogenase